MISQSLQALAASCCLAFATGIIFIIFSDETALSRYAYSISVGTVFVRLWMQQILQRCFANVDSPRFKALPAVLQRHNASLVTRLVVFVGATPPVMYFIYHLFMDGPSTIVKFRPGIQLGVMLLAWLNIVDMSQRQCFDWRLHLHHVCLCLLCAPSADKLDQNPLDVEPGLVCFTYLSAMDEPVWVIWSLDHLRRQRESEPEEERTMNDALENFPPPSMYTTHSLVNLNRFALIYYTVIARVGTALMLTAYMIQNFQNISFFWRWMLPFSLLFFIAVDLDVIKIMWIRSNPDYFSQR